MAKANNKLGKPTPSPTAKAMTSDCCSPFFSLFALEVCGAEVSAVTGVLDVDEGPFEFASASIILFDELAAGVLFEDVLRVTLGAVVCTRAATFTVAQYPL